MLDRALSIHYHSTLKIFFSHCYSNDLCEPPCIVSSTYLMSFTVTSYPYSFIYSLSWTCQHIMLYHYNMELNLGANMTKYFFFLIDRCSNLSITQPNCRDDFLVSSRQEFTPVISLLTTNNNVNFSQDLVADILPFVPSSGLLVN